MALLALTTASAGITVALSKLHGLAAKLVTAATLASSLLLIQIPDLAALLHLSPLHLDEWVIAIAGAVAVSLLPAIQGFGNKA